MLTRGGGVGKSTYKLLGEPVFSVYTIGRPTDAILSQKGELNRSKYEKEVAARDRPPYKGFGQPIKHEIDEPIWHSQEETSEFEGSF